MLLRTARMRPRLNIVAVLNLPLVNLVVPVYLGPAAMVPSIADSTKIMR